jgi:hypothetical protein
MSFDFGSGIKPKSFQLLAFPLMRPLARRDIVPTDLIYYVLWVPDSFPPCGAHGRLTVPRERAWV